MSVLVSRFVLVVVRVLARVLVPVIVFVRIIVLVVGPVLSCRCLRCCC